MSVAATQLEPLRSLVSAKSNWRIFAMDGALLGLFMISACVSVVVLEHPASPIHRWIETAFLRRAIIGALMGLTAICLIYSPWGKRTGAFMNPAMTLCFLRLGRLTRSETAGYIAGQFIGGTTGVMLSWLLLGSLVSHPRVNFAATVPGTHGLLAAWVAEFSIAMLMICVVMGVNRVPRLAPWTGFFAATLVFLYITFEAPLSGMSLNPARTFASSVVAQTWTGWWIYLTAPVLGMLSGVEVHRFFAREHQRLCGKLSHSRSAVCFIRCNCLEEH